MELWIRSQDKTRLTKVEDLYLVHDENNFCDYIGNNIVGHLAKYTKKGRALEVLDEIQNIMREKYATSLDYRIALHNKQKEKIDHLLKQMSVYEMPLE